MPVEGIIIIIGIIVFDIFVIALVKYLRKVNARLNKTAADRNYS
jgi:hypothetical protein